MTEVLEDDQQDQECECTIKYDGYQDTFQVQLVKEWQEKCVIVMCHVFKQISPSGLSLMNS